MSLHTDELRTQKLEALITPRELAAATPLTHELGQHILQARQEIEAILSGDDPRLLVIIGPCSLHDPQAALRYAEQLAPLRAQYADSLCIVMRAYFEKPRTIVGWKGLINDPGLDGSFRIDTGLRTARGLLREIAAMGLPAGVEFLDIISPQYLADLVAWGAIGARTTESQVHRELASGLSCPVGFKNGTGGDVRIAVDAVGAASHPHHFLAIGKDGRAAIATTAGNPDCHVILRGGAQPNFDAASVSAAAGVLQAQGRRAALMIDASHANSGKNPDNQPAVIDDIAGQIERGDRRIVGTMIESHLVAGKQALVPGAPLVYGQSITDGCIDWTTTERVLDRLAIAVRARRARVDARAA